MIKEIEKRPMGTKISVSVNVSGRDKTFWWYLGRWHAHEPESKWVSVADSGAAREGEVTTPKTASLRNERRERAT